MNADAPKVPGKRDFARAQLQAMDDLRRDGKLSLATRMVGLEIFSFVNRRSGCAFPSEVTIGRRLKVDERTVRRAIRELTAADYIKVTRRGRNNVYFPTLTERKPQHMSGIKQDNMSGIDTPPTTPDIHDTDTGHSCRNTGHQCPPNSFNNPLRTLRGSLATALPTGALRESQAREQQKTENEIANALGWQTFVAIPTQEADDLRKRWPIDETEVLELKRKYTP
jgi:hypothetical protein